MKKHIFIMIRYSVLTKNKNAWVIGKNQEFDAYKSKLFSESRLRLHEKLFKSVTFPSLCEMSENRTTVMVFLSNELPAANKKNLFNLVGKKGNFKVIEVSKDENVNEKMDSEVLRELNKFEEDICYATVRLDDDDALADDFEKELLVYLAPEFKSHAISFSKGYNAYYENDAYIAFKLIKYPLIALGLSYINIFEKSNKKPSKVTVYSLGNHTKIDERFPVIIKANAPMFFRTIHEESDIYQRKNTKSKGFDNSFFDFEKVKRCFSSLRENASLISLDAKNRTETFRGGVLTYHNTLLCYSKENHELVHIDSSKVNVNDFYKIKYDYESEQLFVEDLGKFISIDEKGVVILTAIKDNLTLSQKDDGFSIAVRNRKLFLTPLRNGKLVLSSHCRAWEVFRIN